MTYALRVRCTTTVLSRHKDYPIRIVLFFKIVKQKSVVDNMKFVAAKKTTSDYWYQSEIEYPLYLPHSVVHMPNPTLDSVHIVHMYCSLAANYSSLFDIPESSFHSLLF